MAQDTRNRFSNYYEESLDSCTAPVFLTIDHDQEPQQYRALTVESEYSGLNSLEPATFRSIPLQADDSSLPASEDPWNVQKNSGARSGNKEMPAMAQSNWGSGKELRLDAAVAHHPIPQQPEWIEPWSSFPSTDPDVLAKIECILVRSGIVANYSAAKHKIKGKFTCASGEIGKFVIYLWANGDDLTVEGVRRTGDCLSFYSLWSALQKELAESYSSTFSRSLNGKTFGTALDQALMSNY